MLGMIGRVLAVGDGLCGSVFTGRTDGRVAPCEEG